MKNLSFTSLTIASPSQRSANQFKFHPQFNLITGPDNSIGKSTLVKLLLWTFGCEPAFDATWTSTESRCILEFTLDGKPHAVGRSGNRMVLQDSAGSRVSYDKITGEYSKRLANLVGFDVLLPNRVDPPDLEIPPPAYYFLPFYIDQRRSWSQAWHGFDALAQYANWQKPVISYHTGYLDSEHFQYGSKIATESAAVKAEKNVIERINGAIQVVEELAPAVKSTSVGQPVEQVISEIGVDVAALHKELDGSLQMLAQVREQAAQLKAQRQLLAAAVENLGLDYAFAVENTSGNQLQCPLCGTLHDNTLIERAGLLAERGAAERDVQAILDKEANLRERASTLETQVRHLRGQIDEYSTRFADPGLPEATSSSDFLTRLSSAAIQRMALKTRDDAEGRVARKQKEQRRLLKLQRGLLSKDARALLDQRFQTLLRTNAEALGAVGVNLSGVESPLNYVRLFGSGGAAEGTRAALAYYLAVHTMVQEADNEAIPPLIADTPNQHEQTDYNYEAALHLIEGKMSSSQIFVCAMDTLVISRYKKLGEVTWLEPGKRLLDESKFGLIWPLFEPFFSRPLA